MKMVWELTIETKDGEFFDRILFKSFRAMSKYCLINSELYKKLGLVIRGDGCVPVYGSAFKIARLKSTEYRSNIL